DASTLILLLSGAVERFLAVLFLLLGAPVERLFALTRIAHLAGATLARLHFAFVLRVLPRGLLSLPGVLVLHALIGGLFFTALIAALIAALAVHAALRSAAGALLVLLGLLCGSDAACRKQRKRGDAGQQRVLFPH